MLLRGVNVGGKRRLLMADVRQLFADWKGYFKSEYSKLMKNPYYRQMTIRNGNSLEKILDKAKKMTNFKIN